MNQKPISLPALYIIFTMLNAFRRGISRANIWREFRRQKIALCPRLSFWISLCKQAGLLDDIEGRLRVSGHARAWLNKTSEEQTFLLIEAWQQAPKNNRERQFRKRLLWKFKYDKPLADKDRRALGGLSALGLVADGQLTCWGRYFLKEEGNLPTPKQNVACEIKEDHFIAPFDQQIDLLWELEQYLRPIAPGRYSLARRRLKYLNGDPFELIILLERGLQREIPEAIRAQILGQASIRLTQGWVLEFSSPQELKELRRQPNLRKHVEQFLSPQHVLISLKSAPQVLKMFERRGVFAQVNEKPDQTTKKRSHFVKTTPLMPAGKSAPKMEILNKYLQLQQALDILYHAPGYPAEQRRITPLSIEPRGEHTYVIAHCQTRRAQRTFRFDRIEIPGTY